MLSEASAIIMWPFSSSSRSYEMNIIVNCDCVCVVGGGVLLPRHASSCHRLSLDRHSQ